MSTQSGKDKKVKVKPATKAKNWHPPDRSEPDKANWERRNVEHFLNCVLTQLNANNRSGQCLSSTGYDRVSESFYELSGLYHDWKQIKNKFDSLKRDWIAWNQLGGQNSTGLGFDNETRTYTAPDHWWDKMIAINPNCQKFKTKGLEHEELLDQIFAKKTATGKTQWTPGADLPSEHDHDERTVNLFDEASGEEDYYENNDSQFNMKVEDDDFGSESGTKRKARKSPTTSTGKKKSIAANSSRRLSTSGKLHETIERMVDVFENQGNEVTVKKQSDTNEATIPICLAKLNALPGVEIGSNLYIKGTKLMTKPAERAVFMHIPDDETRVIWLKSFGKKKKGKENDK